MATQRVARAIPGAASKNGQTITGSRQQGTSTSARSNTSPSNTGSISQASAGQKGVVRSIGGIVFDVTISEAQVDTLNITDHPVQTGVTISDHAYVEPREVTIIAGKGAANDESAPEETYRKLKELQSKRELFDIITGKDSYKNMLVKSISIVTDQTTEHILIATIVCREVILVDTQSVAVAAGTKRKPSSIAKNPNKSGQTDAARTGSTKNGGSKQAQPAKEDESALSTAYGSFKKGGK